MSYLEKLKDPRWQRKRLELFTQANWSCEVCGDTESTLHAHHKQYFAGRMPWEYEVSQLAVLCKNCHQTTHNDSDRLLEVISRLPLDGPGSRDEVAFLIAGYCGISLEPQHDWHMTLLEVGRSARGVKQ